MRHMVLAADEAKKRVAVVVENKNTKLRTRITPPSSRYPVIE